MWVPSVQETMRTPGEVQSRGHRVGVKRDQLLIHEIKVMRILCHTVQSREAGVIPYTYVKTTDAKNYHCGKCASYV